MTHPNALLTPRARLRLARLIVEDGYPATIAAKMFMVSPITARKWAGRYREEGEFGMQDRSSKPHRIPGRTPEHVKKKIINNPVKKQYGRDQIAALIFIAVAKSVLSLDNIHMMFEIQRQTYDNETAYNYFCREFEQVLWHVFQLDMADARKDTDHNTEKEHGTFSNEKTMLCNMIITVAHKIYLDRYFSLLRDEDTI